MADFVKKTWACDDVITADELNRLEGGVEEALDKGYSCTEEWVTLTDESVTTVVEGEPFAIGELTYSEQITADTIRVTFDGVEYSCPLLNDGSYGAPFDQEESAFDWSEYPFNLFYDIGNNTLTTQIAGTYQIKVEVLEETVEVSECFEKAVATLSNTARVSYSYGTVNGATPTAREAWNLLENGKMERVMLANNYEFSSFTVAYLYEKNGHPEIAPYPNAEVYGTYYRFKTLPSTDEQDVLHDGTYIDVFHPNNTDEYYWVYSNYYAGKHE